MHRCETPKSHGEKVNAKDEIALEAERGIKEIEEFLRESALVAA